MVWSFIINVIASDHLSLEVICTQCPTFACPSCMSPGYYCMSQTTHEIQQSDNNVEARNGFYRMLKNSVSYKFSRCTVSWHI
jgi:hypothetical protein